MQKIKQRAAAIVATALLLVFAGCDPAGSGDDLENQGSPSSPVTITVGVTHSGTVGAFGTSYYQFTTTANDTYTIAVTGASSDLSWDLYTTALAYVWGCDDFGDASDEVDTTPVLPAGTLYYLTVDEWDTVAGAFQLLVSTP